MTALNSITCAPVFTSRTVEAFGQAQHEGRGRVELDGSLVEVPIYLNAKRLLERAALLQLL